MRRWHGSILVAVAIVVALIGSGCAESPGLESIPGSAGRIIDGERCERASYPSALALLERASSSETFRVSCSGVLIAPDAVATAAHCLDGASTVERGVSGDPNLEGPGEDPLEARVVRALLHPGFDAAAFASAAPGLGRFDDVGIALLDRPLPAASAVLLPDTESSVLRESAPVAVVGWGASSAQDFSIGVGEKRCANTSIQELGTFEMQIGARGPRKCVGDSGGPTYLELPEGRRVVGLASHAYDAEDCAQGAVDTRIDVYRAWMDDQLRAACDDGSRSACDPPGLLSPETLDDSEGGCAAMPPGGAVALMLCGLWFRRKRQRTVAMKLKNSLQAPSRSTIERAPRSLVMKCVSSIGSLKNRSRDCQVVRRRGRIYVICKSNPRFKVRQGGAKMKHK